MPNLQQLAQLLKARTQQSFRNSPFMAMDPSPTRSALVEQLLAGSGQNRGSMSAIESLDIASKPIIAALLGRREEKARTAQADQSRAALASALGIPQDKTIQMEQLEGGTQSFNAPGARDPQQEQMAQLLSAMGPDQVQGLAGQLAGKAVIPPERESLINKLDTGEWTPASLKAFADSGGDYSVLVPIDKSEPSSTDDIKEYNFAVEQGYKGTLEQWISSRKPAPPTTTVTVEGDTIPPALVQEGINTSERADLLMSQVEDLSTFRDLARNTETGQLAPITLPIKAAFEDIGIKLDEGVPLQQALLAMQSQMSLRLRNPESGFGLTGNTSNRDLQFLTQAVAQLGNTPEANEAILTIMIAKQRREALLAQEKSQFIFDTGNLSKWSKHRDEFISRTPLFTPQEQDFLFGLQDASNKRSFPEAPSVGSSVDGDDGKYEYIGGDPANQRSWRKVTQ